MEMYSVYNLHSSYSQKLLVTKCIYYACMIVHMCSPGYLALLSLFSAPNSCKHMHLSHCKMMQAGNSGLRVRLADIWLTTVAILY